MLRTLAVYHHLFDLFLLNVGYAFSQQAVMRAGGFSVATAGFASLGAYAAAILVLNYGAPQWIALTTAVVLGTLSSLLLSVLLARLRGVYQAIASLAFVQIILSLMLYADTYTGGAAGLNQIPPLTQTWHLLLAVGLVIFAMASIGQSGIGRAFDAIRQDEVVGEMLGVSVRKYHMMAFCISGAIGGLFGGLHSLLVYSIDPTLFGFEFVTTVLAFIVLGGRSTIFGPIVGAAIITALPEIARPLADNRQIAQGILMILMITYFPNGIADSLIAHQRLRRAARRDRLRRSEDAAARA